MASFLPGLLLAIAYGLILLHLIPASVIGVFVFLLFIPAMLTHGDRPMRMDYNLFLRAAEKMLDTQEAHNGAGRPADFLKGELFAFARFLGSRWMADSYRWTSNGLLLRMPAFKFSFWNAMRLFSSWSKRSSLLLAWDGKVTARLCEADRESLVSLFAQAEGQQQNLEAQVNRAVETAWVLFLKNDFSRAERVLGQLPEAEVFVQPQSKIGMARFRKAVLTFLVCCLVFSVCLQWFKQPWMEGLKPVSVTETQIRDALARYVTDSHHHDSLSNGLRYALSFNFVLPSTNLMTPESLRALREEIISDFGYMATETNRSYLAYFGRYNFAIPSANGWFSGTGMVFDTNAAAQLLKDKQRQPAEWMFGILPLGLAQCHVGEIKYSTIRLDSRALANLRSLRDQGGLEFVERERLINLIVSMQVLSGEASGKRPSLKNWRDQHGLFTNPGWEVLHDTYCALAALEILGGLDRIDREACAKRILKLHRGKGFFVPPPAEYESRLRIRGDAQDTFCAFESLRILGALDRVKDLDQWQFRLEANLSSKPDKSGIRRPTWSEIEAWVCQQRLERILCERKENLNSPVRSLLEP